MLRTATERVNLSTASAVAGRLQGGSPDCGYRIDVVVEHQVILELKTVERLIRVHDAQLLTYLKLSGLRTGLLLNFHSPVLREGIRRFVL